MDKKLKWGCIQPLTGGMYIGARNAIGHDAEWIISYKGLTDTKTNKEGVITSAGNEYSLLTWLNKHDINVPYFTYSTVHALRFYYNCAQSLFSSVHYSIQFL